MEKFTKHISGTEIAVAVILGLVLLLTVVVQLFFGGDVLLLILVLAVCTAVFSGLVFLPETYELGENALAVVNQLLRRSISIPYDTILHIDAVGSFRSSKRDFDSVEVILKYRPKGKSRTRTISCHPKNVHVFVKELQQKCPNLIAELD